MADVAAAVGPSVVTISADLGDGSWPARPSAPASSSPPTARSSPTPTSSPTPRAIRVRLAGDTEPIEAELVASDAGNDLALLRDRRAPTCRRRRFAPAGEVALGDEVVAIGFALDLAGEPSVTLGIVSALDRTLDHRERAPSTG